MDISDAMMEAGYQEQQRQFVSGHNGTQPLEILLHAAPMHCSHLLLISLVQLGLNSSSVVWSLLEWLVLVIPTLLVTTILADFTLQLSLALAALAIASLLLAHFHNAQRKPHSQNPSPEDPRRSAFVSNHRAIMILFTTIAILAVDFPVFPRRFAKTETFGYGLMDLGVGSFTFANGLVSAEARQVEKSLTQNLSGCVPLLLLGSLRLIRFIKLFIILLRFHPLTISVSVCWAITRMSRNTAFTGTSSSRWPQSHC